MSGTRTVTASGYEHYRVSDAGVITNTRTGRASRGSPNGKGYLTVDLNDRGKKQKAYVHRLVAEAFIGPANGRFVNHKDGDKTNNAVENLEWMTVRENNHHAILTGLKASSQETRDMLQAEGSATSTYICESCCKPFCGRRAARRRGWARFCSVSCHARVKMIAMNARARSHETGRVK